MATILITDYLALVVFVKHLNASLQLTDLHDKPKETNRSADLIQTGLERGAAGKPSADGESRQSVGGQHECIPSSVSAGGFGLSLRREACTHNRKLNPHKEVQSASFLWWW